MSDLRRLFENNRRWARSQVEADPGYFTRLADLQAPRYLWIGCSDSRVPANQVVGLAPGEVFVHRNVANLVVNTDMNLLSVLQFAVDVLRVEHVIVCGHYGCGGVRAACENRQLGLVDNWLRQIKDIYSLHGEELDGIADLTARADRLSELNVVEQVYNVGHTAIVQNAWAAGQSLAVHGLIYGLADGLLRDLAVRIADASQLDAIYRVRSGQTAR